MVVMAVRQGGWTVLTVAKDAQRVRNNPRKPRDLLKERYSDSLKRLNIFFLRLWCLKRWWDQNQSVIEPFDSSTEYWGILLHDSLFIALPPYQQRGGGGEDRKQTVNAILIDGPSRVFSSQPGVMTKRYVTKWYVT
jgi:hypothetical protein